MFTPFESSFAKALLDVEQPIPLGINAPGAHYPDAALCRSPQQHGGRVGKGSQGSLSGS